MKFFREVVSHLIKTAFEGHTKFSVADSTAVGDNPIRSISLDAVPLDNSNTMIALSWEGGEKMFEKTLSEKEAAHQFDLISNDLAEAAALTKKGEYDAAKDLMKKLGQKYSENTGEIVETNLPKLHNTQASTEDDKVWKEAKITMQNLWFSTTDELLDYQKKQKGAGQPDQDHVPLWDKTKKQAPADDQLAPASLSYEDVEEQKAKQHDDMQKHIDETIKTELESALQQKAASVFGPDQVELVEVLRKNGRNWDEIKKILVKDFGFDKDSTNIFVDEQRQGVDPTGVEVEPVKEDDKEEKAPLTPPSDLVSPETHDQLLKDHEDKKKDNKPVEAPVETNFTPKDVMDIKEDEITDESSLDDGIARADNDDIRKVAAEDFPTDPKWGPDHEVSPWKCSCGETLKTKNQGLAHYRKHHKSASIKTAGPTDANPLQEPVQQEPTTPSQDVVPMGKKPLDHEAPQKGDRVFVSSDMSDEKAGFEGTFVSSYKSEGNDLFIVETDEGDLLDVAANRVVKISENDGSQTTEPSFEPIVEQKQPDEEIKVTPKMDDFHSSQDEALSIKKEAELLLKLATEKDADEQTTFWDERSYDEKYPTMAKYPEIADMAVNLINQYGDNWFKIEQKLFYDSPFYMMNLSSTVGSREGGKLVHEAYEWVKEQNSDKDKVWPVRTYDEVEASLKEAALKKEAGTTWHDLGMPEPPQAGWKVKHKSGLTGTVVDGNDKFADVTLDKPIKNDEVTCRQLDISWVQLERGDHEKGVYAIYAGDGFGSWNGSVPNWTMMDSGGKAILPRGYTPAAAKPAAPAPVTPAPKVNPKKKLQQPKPMEHDVTVETEPAIDTESALKTASLAKKASTAYYFDAPISLSKLKKIPGIKLIKNEDGGVSATDGENYAVLDFNVNGLVEGFTRYGANDPTAIYEAMAAVVGGIKDEHEMQDIWYAESEANHKKPGHVCDDNCDLYEYPDEKKASDFEKGISQNKTADPVDPAKTQFKDYKITPKYAPKQEAVPATPEIDAVLSKMASLEQNLATLETARQQIQAKMQEEMAKVDQSGNRVEMEAQLQESIEKAAVLISAVESKVVQWKDKLYTLQTEEVSYVPKLTPKEMLAKIYAKFDGAEKYVQDVLNGMLSQAKNVMENTLIRWPNKKSSLGKEATILDDMNHYNDELMAALRELSSPL